MIIQHNLVAMNAGRMYGINSKSQAKTTEKLSSGYRINRAADDAAGLSISEKLRYQIRGLNQGAENIQDGISLCQVADGALSEVNSILDRMTELSVKAANGTLDDSDRKYIQDEVNNLSSEITRIGKTTRFNDQLIFDGVSSTEKDGSITQLVKCASADKGYFGEAYKIGDNNYLSAAYIDFSGVNQANISKLDGGNFGFYCSRGCSEVFDITFTFDKDSECAKNLNGKVHHYYTVDISECKNGSDIVDKILEYVGNNLPVGNKDGYSAPSYGDLQVSHSNNLSKVNSSQLVIYSNTRVVASGNYQVQGYSSAEKAANAYPIPGYPETTAGMIFCSDLTDIHEEDPVFKFKIKCSSEANDIEYITTYRMNASVLGVDPLDVSSEASASESIDAVKAALEQITSERTEIGASQNRLVHSYNTNQNTAENTSAAESKIRDTDMAEMMVKYSNNSILTQASQSMLAQANQSGEMVLSLLQ